MKKLFLAMAVLLLAVLAAIAFLTPAGFLPAADSLESGYAQGEDGVTYVIENRALQSCLYGVDDSGAVVSLYRELGAWRFGQAAAEDGEVYLLRLPRDPGDRRFALVRLDPEDWTGETVLSGVLPAGLRPTGLTAEGGALYLAGVSDDGSGSGWVYQAGAEELELLLLQDPTAQGRLLSARYQSGGIAALLDSGETVLLSGGRSQPLAADDPAPQVPTLSARYLYLLKAPFLVAGALAVAVLTVVLAVVVLLVKRARRLAARVLAVNFAFLLLALCGAAALLLPALVQARYQDRLAETEGGAARAAALISASGPQAMLEDGFSDSQSREGLAAILSGGDGTASVLFRLRDRALEVAVSDRYPMSAAPGDVLPAPLAELAEEASGGSGASSLLLLRGRALAASAQPVTAGGVQVGVLLTVEDTGGLAAQVLPGCLRALALGAAAAAALLLVLALLLRRVTRPIAQLTRQMEAVSDGDTTVREDIPAGEDELGSMARAMQEMCMGLSIRDYELRSTIHSYSRFVPHGLERVLERASIMEVSFGDVRSMTGDVGLLSVNNQDAARARLDDDQFVQFVNHCSSAIQNSAREGEGYLLSTGLGLGAIRMLYQGGAAKAVDSALSLVGTEGRQPSGSGEEPDFFLMLHTGSFLYGIAGTEDEVFPFLSSAELEFLGSYAPRFRDTGARLVLTDAFLPKLEPGHAVRYIGFIASEDEKFSCKLYEVLDTYPDLSRSLRIRYDERLQEGIRLFYRNDFYLARNIFSALLRVCPDDGIVRWYLFACEHFFNCEDLDRVDYRLFGIDQ